MPVTNVRVKFTDEAAASAWFRDARAEGLMPAHAGLRHADALEFGRVSPGDLLISEEKGLRGWLVEPLTQEDPALAL